MCGMGLGLGSDSSSMRCVWLYPDAEVGQGIHIEHGVCGNRLWLALEHEVYVAGCRDGAGGRYAEAPAHTLCLCMVRICQGAKCGSEGASAYPSVYIRSYSLPPPCRGFTPSV